MTVATFLALFATYKYFILFPIAVLEGHVISLIVGFLAKLGYLNPYIAGAVIVTGNLIGDILLYLLGYHKGEAFLSRWGKYIGVTTTGIEKSKALFQTYGGMILLGAKLTNGFGLITAILFTAGMARVPFRTYLLWNVIGELLWTGSLITLGYMLGNLYTKAENVIFRIGLVGFLVIGLLLLLQLYRVLAARYFLPPTPPQL